MRFLRRTPKARKGVDVDPVQLVVIQFLIRFQAGPLDDLFREVSNVRPDVPREMFDTAMADAVAQDILDYRFDADTGKTLMVLTATGRRLKGRLPATTRSRLRVYL
jgi:hypothetical protein